ncbi:MAG: hypothetical protein K8J31_18010, partial [Anaerolineae bacterium]|nr:hypothetical protein [Anaerolineae bacterium]
WILVSIPPAAGRTLRVEVGVARRPESHHCTQMPADRRCRHEVILCAVAHFSVAHWLEIPHTD